MSENPSLRGHLPGLDGLRGIAIALVLLRHLVLLPRDTAPDALHLVTRAGWVGVDLFFVLSGFLITGILYDSRGRDGYFRVFYLRRALRIFPLYYGFLALYLWAVPRAFPAQQEAFGVVRESQGWLWLHASNLLGPASGVRLDFGLNHLWSLAVEEQFYLVWPPLVLLLGRRSLIGVCAAMIVGAAVLRAGLLGWGMEPASIYGLTPTRMDPLAVGALIAILARAPGGIGALARPARRVAVAAGIGVAGVAGWAGGLDELHPLVQTVGYGALALLFGAVVVLSVTAAREGVAARVLSAGALRLFGRHSYAIYLLHMPVLHALASAGLFPSGLGSHPSRLLDRLAAFAIATTVTLALSWVVWHLWEQPFLRLKERVRHAPSPVPAPLPAPARAA